MFLHLIKFFCFIPVCGFYTKNIVAQLINNLEVFLLLIKVTSVCNKARIVIR